LKGEKTMKITRGMIFKGNINNREILVLNVNENCVTYKDLESGLTYNYGTKAFERCYITFIKEIKI
jgi:hypothetical protein